MSLSHRIFVIDRNERLLRLASSKFDRMLRDPMSSPLPEFCGQRLRSASAVVECVALKPVRVVYITFNILTFDENGQLDTGMFDQQQASRAEVALAEWMPRVDGDSNVLQARARFLEKGGRWSPSRALAHAIDEAVLGRKRCPRI